MLTACHTSDALRAFLAGELPPEEECSVARHVQRCSACEREVERLSDDAAARALLGEHRRTLSDRSELPPEVIELGQRLQVLGWCGGAGDQLFCAAPTQTSDSGGASTGHPAAAETPPPPTVGKFEIIRRVGGGGYGVVYLARDRVLQRHVALQMARNSVLADPDLKGRFLREAEVLARLAHSNIVPVYEAGDQDGTCFLATSFCDGPTLADWLRQQAAGIDARLAARIALLLACAVEHAHQHGILHRDIKPGNVLLAPIDDKEFDNKENAAELPFVPKLTGFGLATLTEHASDATNAGAVLGTPQYMAPEQAAGLVERVGPATDVYSLGAVLYEMLSGRPPIRGTTSIDTLRRVLIDYPTPPRHVNQHVPDDLDAIVMKALEKSPTRRYPTARDLAADLQCFLDNRPTLASPQSAIERAMRWISDIRQSCRRRRP